MKRKLLSLLVLLMTAVTGAWADGVIIKFEANGNEKVVDNVTLPYTFRCDYYFENGELDGIIQELYELSSGGFGYNEAPASDNSDVTAFKDGDDQCITINNAFDGTATVTGMYLDKSSSNSFTYTLTISMLNVIDSGSCGTGVTYSLYDDGVLRISGSGAMADYDIANFRPWHSSASSITRVVVKTGVTHIGVLSLYEFTNMTSVSLPEGLLSIGDRAFWGDNNASFTSITIPASVTSIGENAFRSCSALESITIPASVTNIGGNAFYKCTNLATVDFNSNPSIGINAFPSGATVRMNLTANSAAGANWTTFYNQNYSFVADVKTEVFKVALSGTGLTLNKVDSKIVDANVPVVLKTTDGNPVMVKTNSSSDDTQDNSLTGVSTAAGVETDGTFYVLNNGTQGVGFYKLASSKKVGLGKAYLTYSGGAGVREFFGFEEDPTGIDSLTPALSEGEGAIYNVAGQRIQKMQKGINIVNGKKIIK